MDSIFDKATPVVREPEGTAAADTTAQTDNAAAEASAAAAAEAAKGGTPAGTPPAGEGIATPDTIFGEEWKDKKWDDVKADYQTKAQRLAELEKENTEIKGRSPQFADPEIAEYNAWVANGGQKDYGIFSMVRSVDSAALDGVDAIVAQKVIENPNFKGFEPQLKQEIIDQYQLESTDDRPLTDEQIKFNRAKLKVEETKAKEYLTGLKGKMQVKAADPEAATKAAAARADSWAPVVDKTLSDIQKLAIPILKVGAEGKNVKDDKGHDVFDNFGEYSLPEHLKGKYKDIAMQVLSTIDVNDKTAKELPAFLKMRMVIDNLPYIVSHVADVTRKQVIDEYDKRYGGAGAPPPPGAKGGHNGSSSTDKEQIARLSANPF